MNRASRNHPFRVRRRRPKWREIAPLLDLSIRLPSREAALARCGDVWDVRALARRRVPRMVFDFVDGAADTEASLTRARDTFARLEFSPRALRDVSQVNLDVELLGRPSALPFFFAPTGATRLMHASGESGVAAIAAELGIPYCLSTLGTTSVEDLASAAPRARRWFQLYLMADRAQTLDALARARACGFDTLILAVDTPVPGRRNRDVRNGLVVPPRLTWRSVMDIAGHPAWWVDKLTTPPVEFAMIEAKSEQPAQRMARVFDPTITVADVEWLRAQWSGPMVVKGVQSVDDARIVAAAGADAVHLSTHGGRQLDRAPLPFELLPQVREILDPKVQVFVDGGVLSGSDLAACLAEGADAVAIGRAYLYGLMAGGPLGVRRVAELLRNELSTTMALLGCSSVAELRGVPVRLREA